MGPPRALADLGAGHCKFSLLAAEAGWDVTAFDVRNERTPPNLASAGVSFVNADVNAPDFQVPNFNAICILGLLYHLTLDEQVNLLEKCSYTMTLIDTHCAPRSDVEVDGFEGMVVIEDEETRLDPRSAWSSADTFWHTLPSIEKLLRQAGYARVTRFEPALSPHRYFFLCE